MNRNIPLLAFAAITLVSSLAYGQRVPFFTNDDTGYDPEISIVNSGQILDAQAVVSSDLKYVTITTRAASTRLLALREFTFAGQGQGRQGFVGGAGAAGNGVGNAPNPAPARGVRNNDRAVRPAVAKKPSEVRPAAQTVLDTRGMTLVGRFED